ncbi:D-alanyl-D-alanine carboxypeptidase family protein [Paenibacillus sp.]|uniref:D-alanyl-D-alanine carboxypeptidase family protein n=1 Tax=Paenibacillus sp. TaxID=58172 RepID=UPI002D38D0B0|nr:D-alanyl-D-alanine carboxypeptidase family protein [Paenibacillus sp.]HZG56513.1 D-alanyl-D-alanine carboxypeptidase family protein [Paenibacillus sp.]
MKRLGRWAAIVSCALAAQLFAPLLHSAKAAEQVDLGLNVNAALLMDAETGQILYAENENQPYQPASMTKMMTEYLVMEEIESGRLSWDDMIYTTKAAADVIGSGQQMGEGQSYSVRKVFELLSIYSGNDAAVAFAEHISGTEENFAKLMNETAQKLGLSSESHFINSTGLSRRDMGEYAPKTIEGETLLTAHDAAKLAQAIILEHPEVLEITKIPSLKFNENDPKPMINWNWMVEANKDNVNLRKYAYEGLDGLKTGHTSDAGYCFTGTAERNGMRLISVVMGAKSENDRFVETRKLLDYGFNGFEKRTILAAKTELEDVKTVHIRNGLKQDIPVVVGEGIELIVNKADQSVPQLTANVYPEDQLKAPLEAEAQVGTVTVAYGDRTMEVPLIITEEVEKAGWFRMMMRGIGGFFSGLFGGIVGLFK